MSKDDISTITPVVLGLSYDRPAVLCGGNPCVVCGRDNPINMTIKHLADYVCYTVIIEKKDLLSLYEDVKLSKCSELVFVCGFEPEFFRVVEIRNHSYKLTTLVESSDKN